MADKNTANEFYLYILIIGVLFYSCYWSISKCTKCCKKQSPSDINV